jgi:hypothetical protein
LGAGNVTGSEYGGTSADAADGSATTAAIEHVASARHARATRPDLVKPLSSSPGATRAASTWITAGYAGEAARVKFLLPNACTNFSSSYGAISTFREADRD